MLPILVSSLSLLVAFLLLPSPAVSQTLWENPVDFRSSNFWPPELCVQSCLSGDQCGPCHGYSLSTWVGCTTNDCFCSNYERAYFYLYDCIMANCCQGCVGTNPYNLIYGYCASTGDKVNAAAAAGGGSGTVTTTFTAPPSVTPTEKPVSNPYAAEASDKPPTPTNAATTAQPSAEDPGLTRSDKIALGVGLGVGIPSVIAAVIVMIQFCRSG